MSEVHPGRVEFEDDELIRINVARMALKLRVLPEQIESADPELMEDLLMVAQTDSDLAERDSKRR